MICRFKIIIQFIRLTVILLVVTVNWLYGIKKVSEISLDQFYRFTRYILVRVSLHSEYSSVNEDIENLVLKKEPVFEFILLRNRLMSSL